MNLCSERRRKERQSTLPRKFLVPTESLAWRVNRTKMLGIRLVRLCGISSLTIYPARHMEMRRQAGGSESSFATARRLPPYTRSSFIPSAGLMRLPSDVGVCGWPRISSLSFGRLSSATNTVSTAQAAFRADTMSRRGRSQAGRVQLIGARTGTKAGSPVQSPHGRRIRKSQTPANRFS